MKEYIKKQLEKCSFADVSNYDEATNTIKIPKYTKPTFDKGKCYVVKLNISLVNNPNSLAAINWNSGSYPKHEYLKIYIDNTLGKMIHVDSLAVDPETKKDIMELWTGWLPIEEITQICVL